MHIEIQVALNFVISYLYNKLPRRRVNIFGEELEKALKDKFQGHWYPEKPYKGSAFRCLKTGDPIDAVLERAARESGVPIHDILENLPNELSVWVDPGEVSYRIGEKNVVKILYSENSENHEDNSSADREVNKTFNPEAACFRPIDAINTSLNSLSLSPKTSPLSGSSPHSVSSTSPTYKGSPNPVAVATNGVSFLSRTQAPLTFTTATFAQTKFGSTKLKTSSKRSNSSSYRMSPTEFSNYIKQRAIQQQQQQLNHNAGNSPLTPNHFGPIGPVSPARSISPNPLSNADPFYFPNLNMGANMGYQQFNGHRNIFDTHFQQQQQQSQQQQQQQQQSQQHDITTNGIYGGGMNKFSSYLDPNGFYGMRNQLQQQQQQQSQISPQHQNNLNLKIKIGINGLENGLGIKSPSIVDDKDLFTKANIAAKSSNSILSNNNNITINNIINQNNNSNNNKLNPIAVTLSSAEANNHQQQQQQQQPISPIQGQNGSSLQDSKLLVEGLNSFYSSGPSSYQQLLVAN